MKRAQTRRLFDVLLPSLPGCRAKGKLLVYLPLGHVLRAIAFESSAFSATPFYVNVFVQPLYVPIQYLTLTLGVRLRGLWEWEEGREQDLAHRLAQAIQREGMPLLNACGTPEKLAGNASKFVSTRNPHIQEAIAYSLAFIGSSARGIEALDRLTSELHAEFGLAPTTEWVQEMLHRTEQVRERLKSSITEARQLLTEWESSTIKNLGLEEFISRPLPPATSMTR